MLRKSTVAVALIATSAVFAEQHCVSIDPRVDDEWCELDCACDGCFDCNQGICAEFCDWYNDEPTEPPTTTEGPTTTQGALTTTPAAEPHCVSVDPRVSDEWCELDCECEGCPGCGEDYCAGFCDWDTKPATDPNNPTAHPDDPTTTMGDWEPTPPRTLAPNEPTDNLCDSNFRRNVIYLDYKIDWSHLENDIKACIDACFNVIMLSFYVATGNGPADALITWSQMSKSDRQAIINYAHERNVIIMMSLGGATDHIEPWVEEKRGAEYAYDACKFCNEYDLDGVDFDIELTPGNNGPFVDGSMQQFIIDGTMACRNIIGVNKFIAHAPQGPYMGEWAGSSLGYTQVFKQFPNLIDFISVQFYNQGSQYYDTYENLFIAADGWTAESAVLEMVNNGIPMDRIVVGKPVGPAGYASNGYVDPNDLNAWGCQFQHEYHWSGGFMNWMYTKGATDYVAFGEAIAKPCPFIEPTLTPPPTPEPTTAGPTTEYVPTLTPNPAPRLCGSEFQRNVIYLDYRIDWNHLDNDIYACLDACFNVIVMGFFLGTGNYAADALITWTQYSHEQRQTILDKVHDSGAVLMMSLGGATDHIESYVKNGMAAEYSTAACEFCVQYDLDGVDFDIELTPGNNGPFIDGSMNTFIQDSSQACRDIIGNKRLISHAPQGPYMGEWAGENLGYTQIFREKPNLIDFVNVQFYNQGSQYYVTYDNQFVAADDWTAESAVKEMIDNGIPRNKIVVGKPVGPSGYANNGYVDPATLQQWGCRAKEEFGWEGGFMNWMYSKGYDDYVYFGNSIVQPCE